MKEIDFKTRAIQNRQRLEDKKQRRSAQQSNIEMNKILDETREENERRTRLLDNFQTCIVTLPTPFPPVYNPTCDFKLKRYLPHK